MSALSRLAIPFVAAAAIALPAATEAGSVRISNACNGEYQIGNNSWANFEYSRTGGAKIINDRAVRNYFFRTTTDVRNFNRDCEQTAQAARNYRTQQQRVRQNQRRSNSGNNGITDLRINRNGSGTVRGNIGGIRFNLNF